MKQRQTNTSRRIGRLVRPVGMATHYLPESLAPFRMVKRGSGKNMWCYIYRRRRLMFDCNPTFGRLHFAAYETH